MAPIEFHLDPKLDSGSELNCGLLGRAKVQNLGRSAQVTFNHTSMRLAVGLAFSEAGVKQDMYGSHWETKPDLGEGVR